MARELAPAGLRSSPETCHLGVSGCLCSAFGRAAPSSGSKLPPHKSGSSCVSPSHPCTAVQAHATVNNPAPSTTHNGE
nr:hypothetical protein C1892_17455 [Pseudomonas sp. MPBD7-1]